MRGKTAVKKKTKLSIREDKNGTVYVAGLVQKTILDEANFAALLTQGSSKRATASTNMNAVSSRSHAILTVTLHRQVLEEKHLAVEGAHQMETTSHFRLVDLAGSERAKRTNASGNNRLLVLCVDLACVDLVSVGMNPPPPLCRLRVLMFVLLLLLLVLPRCTVERRHQHQQRFVGVGQCH